MRLTRGSLHPLSDAIFFRAPTHMHCRMPLRPLQMHVCSRSPVHAPSFPATPASAAADPGLLPKVAAVCPRQTAGLGNRDAKHQSRVWWGSTLLYARRVSEVVYAGGGDTYHPRSSPPRSRASAARTAQPSYTYHRHPSVSTQNSTAWYPTLAAHRSSFHAPYSPGFVPSL